MNFHLSVFPGKKLLENICKKSDLGVITLQYLQFLVRAMTQKKFIEI